MVDPEGFATEKIMEALKEMSSAGQLAPACTSGFFSWEIDRVNFPRPAGEHRPTMVVSPVDTGYSHGWLMMLGLS